jgi:hypothetical protein
MYSPVSLSLLELTFSLSPSAKTLKFVSLHNEELRDLYSLPSIIRIIKLKRMR